MATLHQTFRGYLYQDLATAIQFASSLLGEPDEVCPEKKLHSSDIFDDLSVRWGGKILKRQLKHSDKVFRKLMPEDLRTQRSNIRVDSICRAIKIASKQQMTEFRLCATWQPPDDLDMKALLMPASGTSTFPGYPTQLFRIDINKLWPNGGNLFWQSLDTKGLRRPEYRTMCECLLLELGCPPMSASLITPGRAEEVLSRLLTEEIGIGRFPNEHLNATDIAGRLIYEAQAARANGIGLSQSDVVSLLRLRTDHGRVSQMFPVRWKEAIDFANVRKNILDLVKGNQHTLVTGPPGSGKSWALTRLARDLEQEGFAVGRHYCYVSVNDADAPKRILIDTLYGNLTDSLIEAVPDFAALNRPFFAAGPAEFQGLLARACAEYPDKQIVLMIDGLDHIARIRALHGEIPSMGSDIVGELANLRLPKNASLVLGSQPGDHLRVLESNCRILRFPAWTAGETKHFLSRVGIRKNLAEYKITAGATDLANAVHQRSNGNPLYTWYLVQEIRKSLSRQDARTPIEIISAAPAYDEHLNAYYTFLLESGQAATESVASILACIDFGLTRHQLRDIGGTWAAVLLDATLNGLRPVLDEASSQGGIRIYHDSFRRFILNRIGSIVAIAKVLAPVIVWLQNRGFYEDSLAFRFLIPGLARAGRDAEILSLITPTFVSKAIGGGYSQVAIMANLAQAAWASVRSLDLSQLAAIAELHKAAWTAFEDNLRFRTLEYGSAFAAVFGGPALAERLLFDGKPTLQRDEGLLLCQVCDRNGASAPWAEYKRLEEQRHEEDGWERPALADFTGLLRLRGFPSLFKNVAKFLKSRDEQSPIYLEGILREIARIEGPSGLSQLAKLKFKCNSTAAAVYFECVRTSLESGQQEQAKAFLLKSARRAATPVWTAKCIDVGMSRLAIARLVKEHENLKLKPPPSDGHSPRDDSQLGIWISLVQIHGYIRNPQLQKLRTEITAEGWYPAWLRFVVDLFTATSLTAIDASKAIIVALRELATFQNPFEGSPRACDLYFAHGVIGKTFRRALQMTEAKDWPVALALLEEISNGTSTHIQGERGFSGPLSSGSLASILEEFVDRADVSQICLAYLAKLAAAVEEKGEYYSSIAQHRFGLAEAQAKCGFGDDSLKSWRFASRALCGYGWRKDRTVWELFEPIPMLSQLDQAQAEFALQDSQPFAEAVLLHTDGRETKHAPNGWFAALSGTNPAHAAIILARSISDDGGTWHWRWETAMEDFLEQVQCKSDPSLILLLDLTRPWEPRGNWQKYDRMAVLKKLGTDSPLFRSTKAWIAAKLRDEPDPPDRVPLDVMTELAPDVRIPPSEPPPKVPSVESILGEEERRFDPILREPRIPPGATPLQILSAMKRNPGEYGSQIRLADWVNSLGYRLIELLDSGDSENTTRIIVAFGAEWHYEGAGEILLQLADGFNRHGYSNTACEALAIAFRQLGESQALGAFTRAVTLNRTRAVQVIIETYARLLDQSWGVHNIPMRLMMVAVALQDPKLAFSIRRHAAAVIEERLWGTQQTSLTFAAYDPTELPVVEVDKAICYLIVARTSHPENWRRLSAMTSIAILVQQNSASIAWGIDQYLRNNTLATSTVSILELLWEFEGEPYEISKRLAEILEDLARTELFSVAILARNLLNRAGITVAARPELYIPRVFVPISPRRVEAVRSLDSDYRLERLESIWGGASALLATELDQMFQSDKQNRERMHRRWKAFRDQVYPERPVTLGNCWEKELFELVLQRMLTTVPELLLRIGAWSVDSEHQLLQFVSPGTVLHVARILSRVPRPNIAPPSEVESNQIEALETVDIAGDEEWFLLGRFEEQILLARHGTSEPSRQFTVYAGVIAESMPNSFGEIPFGNGNWQHMWSGLTPSLLNGSLRWGGPLVGYHMSDSYLGRYPFLGLSSELCEMVSLDKGPIGKLILVDVKGEPAVKMRSWWTLRANDHRERGDRELAGCELIARSDVMNAIRKIASHRLLLSTVVHQRQLTQPNED